MAFSTGSVIRLEINWCRAKKFLALTVEVEHNILKVMLKSTLLRKESQGLTGVLDANGNGEKFNSD